MLRFQVLISIGSAPTRLAPSRARSDDPRDPATVEKRAKTGVFREGLLRKPAFVNWGIGP